jgi:hypothetical protein
VVPSQSLQNDQVTIVGHEVEVVEDSPEGPPKNQGDPA